MSTRKRKFVTAGEWIKLHPSRYEPEGSKESEKPAESEEAEVWEQSKESRNRAIAALVSWTGSLSEEELAEAHRLVEHAAKRYLFFRKKREATPTPSQVKTALNRRLHQFRSLRTSLESLPHFEYFWINGQSPLTPTLQLDLEAAEYAIEQQLKMAESEGYWTFTDEHERIQLAPKFQLLVDCRTMMVNLRTTRVPGSTKGKGPLARLARAIHEYAVGSRNPISLDREIEALRALDRTFLFLPPLQKRRNGRPGTFAP
jgi:hypothetical protein